MLASLPTVSAPASCAQSQGGAGSGTSAVGGTEGRLVACHRAEEIRSGAVQVPDPTLRVEPDVAAPAAGARG